MAHIMMPSNNGDTSAPKGKYADLAVDALINEMQEKGAVLKDMIATCIGGATMFGKVNGLKPTIGERNVEIVKSLLTDYTIPIMIESVGGFAGRKVALDCNNGAVTVTMLNKKFQYDW